MQTRLAGILFSAILASVTFLTNSAKASDDQHMCYIGCDQQFDYCNQGCDYNLDCVNRCYIYFDRCEADCGRQLHLDFGSDDKDATEYSWVDPQTQSEWSKADGLQRKWPDASAYCENLTWNGHSDWSLPSSGALTELARHNPPSLLTGTSLSRTEIFWTQTTYPDGFNMSMYAVYFPNGTLTNIFKTSALDVVCVR